MDSKVKKQKYYYLNREYESGMVHEQITGVLKYDVIAGLDFGHGESVIYKIYKGQDGEWKLERVQMTADDDFTVPTLMAYDVNGKAVIGSNAQYADSLIQCFKEAPENWGNQATGNGKTYGELIEDYIAALWSGAMTFDKGLAKAAKDGSLLIAVGCPASPAWTSPANMKKYADLVRSATGCSSVAVMPESNAAIMNAICSSKEGQGLDLSRGVAIYDAGSSTIDFTYVLMGQVMITRSLRVGGADLDRAIRERILRDRRLAGAAVSERENLKLRFNKEQFYNSGGKAWNEYVLVVGNQKVNYTMDDDLMNGAVWGTPLEYPEEPRFDGKAVAWSTAVSNFLYETRALAAERGCGTVVLTGGTSRVMEFRQLVYEVFSKLSPKPEIREETNPSYSVAKGLCQAKLRECEAASALEGIVKDAHTRASEISNDLMDDLAGYIFNRSMSSAAAGVKNLIWDAQPHRLHEITDAAKDGVSDDDALLPACRAKTRTLFREYGAKCRDEITDLVNDLSGSLYGGKLSGSLSLPKIESDLPDDMFQRLKLDDILSANILGNLISTHVCNVVETVVEFLAFFSVIGAFFLDHIANLFNTFRRRNKMLSPETCGKILSSMYLPEPKIEKKAVESIRNSLQTWSELEDAFSEMADELLDISIGMILLEVFEEYGAEEQPAASAEKQPAL